MWSRRAEFRTEINMNIVTPIAPILLLIALIMLMLGSSSLLFERSSISKYIRNYENKLFGGLILCMGGALSLVIIQQLLDFFV
jgi:hypothetical protein